MFLWGLDSRATPRADPTVLWKHINYPARKSLPDLPRIKDLAIPALTFSTRNKSFCLVAASDDTPDSSSPVPPLWTQFPMCSMHDPN